MSAISSSSTVINRVNSTEKPSKASFKSARKWEKGVKAALALKITAIVSAIVMMAATAAASVLLSPISAVIGASVTVILLLGSVGAMIAQEMLLKNKRKAEEKALKEKDKEPRQVIQNLKEQAKKTEEKNQQAIQDLKEEVKKAEEKNQQQEQAIQDLKEQVKKAEEKNQQQEQVIQDLKGPSKKFEIMQSLVQTYCKEELPNMITLLGKMDKFQESTKTENKAS